MKRTQEICRLGAVICSMAFVWAIAVDMDVLPALSDSVFLRWQITLVCAIFLWVVADRLADLRCRCCGSDRILLRALLTRSHELLCRRCLSWNPSSVPAPKGFVEARHFPSN